jgi:hypothetical protein
LFILIPVLILSLAALTILLLQWFRPNFGFSWLLASVAAFMGWLSLVLLRLRLPVTLMLIVWKPPDLFNASPALLMDRFSWPYGLALLTLTFAAILTASARAQYNTNPYAWAGSLAVSALGLVAILAGNPLTLMMAWVAVDLVEFIILQGTLAPAGASGDTLGEAPQSGGADQPAARQRAAGQRIILAYSARTVGVLLFFLAIVLGGADSNTFSFKHISIQTGLLIFMGCGLRLGVLPLHLPFSQEPRLRRGLGTILRLVPVVSTLVPLARLPADIIPVAWGPWLLGLVSLAALYGGAMWLGADDELNGRPYWMLGWAALAFTCVIRGAPISSVAWGIVLLLQGGFLFLYSARERYLAFLPVLGVLGMIGLPFTPAASGWAGLFEPGFNIFSVLVYIAQCLQLAGFIRHALRKGDSLAVVDRWAQVVYPTGLFFFMITDVILGIWGWPGSLTSAYAWAGILPILGGGIFLLLTWRRMGVSIAWINRGMALPGVQAVLNRLSVIIRLDWLYGLIGGVYQTTGRVLGEVTAVLEGDGGVLWALLLLSLLISLISTGGF